MRWECTCSTLSVDKKIHWFVIHDMLFDLGNIVRHIINDMHIKIVWRFIEHFAESLTRQESENRTVHPGEISSSSHTPKITLTLRRMNWSTSQLSTVNPMLCCYRSFTSIPYWCITRSISTRESEATWWPSPRLPLWIMTTTCPLWSIPIFLAAATSKISSTTWISA